MKPARSQPEDVRFTAKWIADRLNLATQQIDLITLHAGSAVSPEDTHTLIGARLSLDAISKRFSAISSPSKATR
jgi:hypothetical protein